MILAQGWEGRMAKDESEAFYQMLEALCLHDEWRRGVGRQAPQSGGGSLLWRKDILEACKNQRVQIRCTHLVPRF
jgi:hypothetical protein